MEHRGLGKRATGRQPADRWVRPQQDVVYYFYAVLVDRVSALPDAASAGARSRRLSATALSASAKAGFRLLWVGSSIFSAATLRMSPHFKGASAAG